jgi:hypothetical protein
MPTYQDQSGDTPLNAAPYPVSLTIGDYTLP